MLENPDSQRFWLSCSLLDGPQNQVDFCWGWRRNRLRGVTAASFSVPIHISGGSADVIAPLRGRFKRRCKSCRPSCKEGEEKPRASYTSKRPLTPTRPRKLQARNNKANVARDSRNKNNEPQREKRQEGGGDAKVEADSMQQIEEGFLPRGLAETT